MTSQLDTIVGVTQVTCIPSLAGQAPALLSAGIHSFPFKLGLPLGLPSTFLGKHGWVQFFCKAAIKENGGLVHKNQQVFIVMNPIDLNVEPPVLAVSCGASFEDIRCTSPCSGGSALCCGLRCEHESLWLGLSFV